MLVIIRSGGAQDHYLIGDICFMSRQKPTDEIETLRRQREQLDARLKAAEARKKEKDRSDDLRRKAIAGSLALEYIAANPGSEFARVFSDLVNKAVSRSIDRALFAALLRPAHEKRGAAENGRAIAANGDEGSAAPPASASS
jgi:hypothetical protein